MKTKPIIAIIGRPNVGKSTLFNRLIRSKKSIIDSTPGVTRDIISGDFKLNDIDITLYDTGGITDEGDILNPVVQQKTLEALNLADMIIFLVEAANPLPVEQEFIKIVRKSNKTALLVMNKSDSPEKDVFSYDFLKFGIGEPIPISASHNRNIDLLHEALYDTIKSITIQLDNDTNIDKKLIKIAIVGKPNVGKSSLLNRLTNSTRSIVSPIPGTTRDVVDETINYGENRMTFLDTAGIRRKSKVHEDIEYYSVNRSIKSIEEADITLLVIDSQDNVTDQDKKITDQIVKNGKGLIVLLSKSDLFDDDTKIFEKKKEKLLFKFPQINYAPVIPISTISGRGTKTLLNKIIKVHSFLSKKISTSQLNNFIQNVVRKYSPSSKSGTLKIYYGVHASIAPAEFIFFINNLDLMTDNYKQYITNSLRKEFDYEGIPIKIIFKNK